MFFQKTKIGGVIEVQLDRKTDERGFFARSWCRTEFEEAGLDSRLVQCSISYNERRGTLRGMHYQAAPFAEVKLVRCTRGSMFDVVLDVRRGSPTCKKWFAVELSAENGRMLYLPEGCAHGYQTLEDNTEMHYMASAVYTPSAALGARFDDPAFQIHWPLAVTAISEQDRSWPLITA